MVYGNDIFTSENRAEHHSKTVCENFKENPFITVIYRHTIMLYTIGSPFFVRLDRIMFSVSSQKMLYRMVLKLFLHKGRPDQL